jgi:hypothetical protein
MKVQGGKKKEIQHSTSTDRCQYLQEYSTVQSMTASAAVSFSTYNTQTNIESAVGQKKRYSTAHPLTWLDASSYDVTTYMNTALSSQ